ncbi:MAG: ABC transporter permease [Endomicrobium sp.]|jgi:lipoprotein-releasing system permease protein|nr:ABC transporter permease [Endomicrobium sp.]
MNILSVELFIALRYLKTKGKGSLSVLTTLIAIGGTALGVASLVITLSIMSGFQSDIQSRILGVQPHIIVTNVDDSVIKNYFDIENKIKKNKFVLNVSPFICKQGMIYSSNSSAFAGIVMKAVNYKNENVMLNISKKIKVSDIKFNNEKIGKRSIILGSELAKNISSNVGDEVAIMFPGDFKNFNKLYKFVVVAIIESGIYDFDSSFGLIDLEEGQKFFLMQNNEITGFNINTNNFDKATIITSQLQNELSYPYIVRTWAEMNKNLFSALKLEKIMMFLILGLIILVAAFNIVSNILLLSIQKSKEIGIMCAMGFSKFMISKIFFYEGIIIGFIGNLLGLIVGLVISFSLKFFDIFKLPKDVYYVNKLPVVIVPSDIITIVISAFIITLLAGVYPAYQISKLDPLEAIKYR